MRVLYRWAILSSALVAVACVGVQSAQAQERLPVTVALGDVSLNKLVFIVAGEAGIYKKNGLDVAQFISPSAAETIRHSGVNVPPEFVRAGEGEISIGGGSPMMVGMTTNARALDRVILATNDNTARFRVVSRPDITAAESLKGKRIGYSSYGALSHMLAIVFVKRMGWDPDRDVSLISNGMAVEALEKGRVDAFVGDEIPRVKAVKAGFRDLVDLNAFNVPMAGSGVNADRLWLESHRETARRFIKSTVDAIALAKTDKKVVIDAMIKWYHITDPEQQEHIYADVAKLARKPYPAIDGVKKVMEIYDYHEMRIHKAEDFYDASFVTELDKSGYIDGLYR